jgi:hypothetical protein
MRTHFPVIAIAAVGAGGLLFACTVTTTTNNNVPDAGQEQPVPDSSTPEPDTGTTAVEDSGVDASDAAPVVTPQAYVRVAHWSPDAPAVDFCVNPVGAAWTGALPQIAQIVGAGDAGTVGDGGAASITFPQVTSYLIIPPDSYEVRLVAAGSADCSTGLVDLASVTLAANSYTTIAALGEAAPVATDQPLSLAAFTDEVSAPAGQIALRFINAAPASPALALADLGTGSLAGAGGPFAPIFTGVAFGQIAGADGGAVDAQGYVATSPLATATLSAHPSSAAADGPVALNDVTIPATSAATVALINGISNGLPSGNAKLLQCADVDDSMGTSLLSTCSIISTQ